MQNSKHLRFNEKLPKYCLSGNLTA